MVVNQAGLIVILTWKNDSLTYIFTVCSDPIFEKDPWGEGEKNDGVENFSFISNFQGKFL